MALMQGQVTITKHALQRYTERFGPASDVDARTALTNACLKGQRAYMPKHTYVKLVARHNGPPASFSRHGDLVITCISDCGQQVVKTCYPYKGSRFEKWDRVKDRFSPPLRR